MSCLKITINGVTVSAMYRGDVDLFTALWRLWELKAITDEQHRVVRYLSITTRFDREILDIIKQEIPEAELTGCGRCQCAV